MWVGVWMMWVDVLNDEIYSLGSFVILVNNGIIFWYMNEVIMNCV